MNSETASTELGHTRESVLTWILKFFPEEDIAALADIPTYTLEQLYFSGVKDIGALYSIALLQERFEALGVEADPVFLEHVKKLRADFIKTNGTLN